MKHARGRAPHEPNLDVYRVPLPARLLQLVFAPFAAGAPVVLLAGGVAVLTHLRWGVPASAPGVIHAAIVCGALAALALMLWIALRHPVIELDHAARVLRARHHISWHGARPRIGPVEIPLGAIDRVRRSAHGSLVSIHIRAGRVRLTTHGFLQRPYELHRTLERLAVNERPPASPGPRRPS